MVTELSVDEARCVVQALTAHSRSLRLGAKKVSLKGVAALYLDEAVAADALCIRIQKELEDDKSKVGQKRS